MVWGFLRATGFAEGDALLWHGIFCCSLVLLGGRVVLAGSFCCSLLLPEGKLLWQGGAAFEFC